MEIQMEASVDRRFLININDDIKDVDGKISVRMENVDDDMVISALMEIPYFISNIDKVETDMYELIGAEILSIDSGNIDKTFLYSIIFDSIRIKEKFVK